MSDDSDENLMLRFRDGDTPAFEALVRRHRRPVYQFILRSIVRTGGVGSAAQAEDLLQETFLRVVRHADNYRREARFTTWLYTLARNLCIDASRRARHRRVLSLDAPTGPDGEGETLMERTPDDSPAVDRRVIGIELQGRLQRAIAALPDDQREVFLMRETADLQFKEIAAIIGTPENTVKSRMRYALEKLREALDDYHEDQAQAVS